MSIIAKQIKLSRDVFAINTNTVREIVALQLSGVRQFFDANQELARKLPEVRDFSSLVEVQRGYGQTLLSDAQSNMRAGGEIVKGALTNTGAALREAFNSADNLADDAAEETAQAA